MKISLLFVILIASMGSFASSDIYLSKKIKSNLRQKINQDLERLKNYHFRETNNKRTLDVMGVSSLNSYTALDWLNARVNYVVEEKALSFVNLLLKRAIFVERTGVIFPNHEIVPYSSDLKSIYEIAEENIDHEGINAEKSYVVMSNIGAALYLNGKNEGKVYGMKISKGFLRKSEKVVVESPRAGIIQIGEGLFAPELAVNRSNENAMANTISRLATFFHEARHSDGNGQSLSFAHAVCPDTHDYAGAAACDENLNGPYSVGQVMINEMLQTCENDKCSESDKEILNLLIIDNASRILTRTHKNENAKNWDATPESL